MAKAAKEQAVKYEEMLREVHQAGVVALEAEREEERGRHQEEVERLREDFDTRLHQELEELTQSHKAEVGLLQQQYQTQLDSLTLSHQQNMAQAREVIEKSVMTRTEKEFQCRLQQLQSEHTSQLRVVEEEGAERVAQVHQELERVKVYTFLVYVVLCVCVCSADCCTRIGRFASPVKNEPGCLLRSHLPSLWHLFWLLTCSQHK
ncbi:hypothetical protein GBAR_LOCUS27993 [Geodia barretti]|uniref:Uncharacterized protein n=1 Tax=Geodia barretti TaxID=519541 RepID=A0AA35TND9_GEOBA|nr:hypothetical protein GBAR_LOCUS27993 [Geodia barretti]